jgi:hypothetical protein
MKLLLVSGSDELYGRIFSVAGSAGFDIILYRDILKAMDNIEELDPDTIVIGASDFPRHWKPLVHYARTVLPTRERRYIILVNEGFSAQDKVKARFLGVTGFLNDSLKKNDGLECLKRAFLPGAPAVKDAAPAGEGGKGSGRAFRGLALIFTNPETGAFVTGKVKKISTFGLTFTPDHPYLVRNLAVGMVLADCSLRVGAEILRPVCKIDRLSPLLSIKFDRFTESEKTVLKKCLVELAKTK